MAHLFDDFLGSSLTTILGQARSRRSARPMNHQLHGALVLLVAWLLLFWMHRRKFFLRI